MELPKRYDPSQSEPRWQQYWEQQDCYRFDPESEKTVFSVDTPPPTVSGKMHIGHAFSFSHQDFIVRYKRMQGFNIFCPFGTDDNGLPTERLIEKMKNVRATKMKREEFIKLCEDTLSQELRPKYVQDWKRIGMSCDWSISYTTIDAHSRRISQRMFLDLVRKKRAYRKETPVIWDPQMQTALSQVEIKDEEKESTFNDIVFRTEDGKDVVVATTRPELLSSCVAVFIHPDDKKNAHLLGKELIVPYYHFKVPVLKDERVDLEKGTGVVMCCTFGDLTDIEWYKAYDLPLKEGIGKDGRMTDLAGDLKGLKVKEARERIIEAMKTQGELIGQKKIKHTVNVGERSGADIEFINSPQWFISYLDLKEEFLRRGKEMEWHPAYMRHRLDNWINGLQWDWCISRQRFFGVPFPVWYDKKTREPIFADDDQLPVDPLVDLPRGYTRDQVEPEQDVLDTWATSSLTPHIAAELFRDHKIYDRLLPMSLRPQAHDIITFWLFNTLVRSHIHDDQIPFKKIMISGFALDPHGKKMSKSKGNVVEPQVMIAKYSADALRFWSAGTKLGDDLPFQEKDLMTGKKTITKLWNASKFTLLHLDDLERGNAKDLETMDRWILSKMQRLIRQCTDSFDAFDFGRAKHETEKFFWQVFCDLYLEIVKDRLYNAEERGREARESAQETLYRILLTILRLFAPIIPHITEEIYQQYFRKKEDAVSIHTGSWPVV
ncbi:MAG: valine--tRNA ligase, partial [DPANN group archaeon]|nr:valine--tRNA ligase [DPANN group archaeon]